MTKQEIKVGSKVELSGRVYEVISLTFSDDVFCLGTALTWFHAHRSILKLVA